MDPAELEALRSSGQYTYKTREQGAATSVLVATAPALEGHGGRYFEDCQEADVVAAPDGSETHGVAAYALDPAAAERLWELSLAAVAAGP
jgi:hypothetical protein